MNEQISDRFSDIAAEAKVLVAEIDALLIRVQRSERLNPDGTYTDLVAEAVVAAQEAEADVIEERLSALTARWLQITPLTQPVA